MYRSKNFYLSFYFLSLAVIFLPGCSLVEDPTNNLLRQAKQLEYSGKFTEAEDAYKKACDLNKKADLIRLSVLLNEARFYLRSANYDKAILTSQEGLKVCQTVLGPTDILNTSFLFVLASVYDNEKNYDTATEFYKKILTFAPSSPCSKEIVVLLSLIKLGDIEFKKDNLAEALKLYKNAYAIAQVTEMMGRLTSYRLALCYMALNYNYQAELYFQKALPELPTQSAPKNIYVDYAKFLAKYGKPGGAGLAIRNSDIWYAKHKEYLDWYYPRSSPGTRCRLIDIATKKDYDLVYSIKQSTTK